MPNANHGLIDGLSACEFSFGGAALTKVLGVSEKAAADEADFLGKVGERIRTARARKGISRKALSDASGVSQRYLAQLEGGDGNVSISLLKRIAKALDHRLEWLVGDDDPWSSDVIAATTLFRSASEDQRKKVFEILDPDRTDAKRERRIALIGLRGAGKSTLGRRSAATLKIPFIELNTEIEKTSGMPINELIALYGQEGYRRLERQSVESIASIHDTIVLAVAGGIVSEPDTFSFLLRNYYTIWLRAKPEEHMGRVRKQGDMRPMAGNPAAMDELKSILTSRESLYARSEAQVDTSGRTVEESASELLSTIRRLGFFRSASREKDRHDADRPGHLTPSATKILGGKTS